MPRITAPDKQRPAILKVDSSVLNAVPAAARRCRNTSGIQGGD
jgi:hypothetical protein